MHICILNVQVIFEEKSWVFLGIPRHQGSSAHGGQPITLCANNINYTISTCKKNSQNTAARRDPVLAVCQILDFSQIRTCGKEINLRHFLKLGIRVMFGSLQKLVSCTCMSLSCDCLL